MTVIYYYADMAIKLYARCYGVFLRAKQTAHRRRTEIQYERFAANCRDYWNFQGYTPEDYPMKDTEMIRSYLETLKK